MANKGSFLINTVDPSLAPTAVFNVDTCGIRLTASGLVDSDFVQIEQWVGPNPSSGDGAWVALAHAGQLVQLNATNTQRIFILEGNYRVTYGGSADVRVYMQQDELELDGRLIYDFNQPYGAAGGGGGGGFAAAVADTDSIDSHFTGDTTGGTFSADVNISADAGNQTSIHADGIYTPASGGGGSIPYTAEDADFTVDATSHGYGVTVDEGTVTATLPAATAAGGQQYYIIASFGGGAAFQITPDGTDTINGANTPFAVASLVPLVMYCDGVSGWMLIGGA